MSELEKLQQRAAEAEQARDAALKTANERLVKAAFIAEAGRLGVRHPLDAYRLSDLAAVQIDTEGNVTGVAEQVEALVNDGRVPLNATKPTAPNLDATAGGATRPTERPVQLSAEELRIAKRMNLTPEQYAAAKVK